MELQRIYFQIENVINSDLSWEAKFDIIFSPELSQQFCKLAPSFDWYDPDTTYEEDVMAFFDAAKEYLWSK